MPHTHETQGLVLVSLVHSAAKIVGMRWLIRRTGKDGKAENMVEANQSGFGIGRMLDGGYRRIQNLYSYSYKRCTAWFH